MNLPFSMRCQLIPVRLNSRVVWIVIDVAFGDELPQLVPIARIPDVPESTSRCEFRCNHLGDGYCYFTGSLAFSSSNQCSTTTKLAGVALGSLPPSLIIRKRWPSNETS